MGIEVELKAHVRDPISLKIELEGRHRGESGTGVYLT